MTRLYTNIGRAVVYYSIYRTVRTIAYGLLHADWTPVTDVLKAVVEEQPLPPSPSV